MLLNKNAHRLALGQVKSIPFLLKNSVILADSLTRDDSVFVVTETMDKENRPVIGAIRLRRGNCDSIEIDANILTIVYSRANIKIAGYFAESDNDI